MKEVMKRVAALALLLGGACTADYPSLYIQQNQVPEANCRVPGTTVDALGTGFLDVSQIPGGATNPGYIFTPLLVNALAAGTTTTQHLMFIAGADVEILSTGSARSTELVNTLAALDQARTTALISGSIKPGGTQGAAFNIINIDQVQTINTFLSQGERVNVVARVSIKANVDGSDITGKPFDYPLLVCRGCLLFDLGPCAGLGIGFTGMIGGVCNPLQDGNLECCDNFAVCPARGPAL
jgi:hypothetical protein